MTKFRRKYNKLAWVAVKLSFVLLVFVIGSSIGMQIMKDYYEKKYANPVKAFYFTGAEIVDPIPNATQNLYITGGLREGVCYPIK